MRRPLHLMNFYMKYPLATLLCLLLLLPSLRGWADTASLLNPLAEKPAAEAAAPAPTKTTAELLADAKADLAKFNLEQTAAPATADAASDDEVSERRNRFENIVRSYEDLTNLERQIAELQKNRDAFQQDHKISLDPTQGPPFNLTYADTVVRNREDLAANLASGDLQLEFMRQTLQTQLEDIKTLEAEKRLQEEAAETAPDATTKEQAARAVQWAQLKLREGQATLAYDYANVTLNEHLVKFAREKLARAIGQEDLLRNQIVFNKTELDAINEKIRQRQADYSKELTLVSRYAKQARRNFEAKNQEYSAEKDKNRGPDDAVASARLADLEKQNNDLNQELAHAEHLQEMVQHSLDIAGQERLLWDARFKIFNQRNPETIAAARNVTTAAKRWVEGRSKVLIGKITNEFVGEQEFASLVKAKIIYGEVRTRVLTDAERVNWLANRTNSEIQANDAQGSLSQYVKNRADDLGYQLKILWNYELFTVDENTVVDGKAVAISRGITFGKLVRALIFILLGALAVIILARMGEKYVIRHFGWRAESALIARRWIHRVGVVALIISAMAWVNIPLSIFAFMGGALAIGFGFGVQNLFKNLICGVMLLLERPLRIGDLVELDGVRGTVINIGIRSVTIRGANGVETLVPNSLFIEQKLTNWTYSSPVVRHNFSVGVDYQAPVTKVREILEAALRNDPAILQHPKPEVSLDDFGADSLIFSVYYWVDLSAEVSTRNIASELRYLICKEFAAAKINMAYTQRDVHLHASAPLRVQVLNLDDDKSG